MIIGVTFSVGKEEKMGNVENGSLYWDCGVVWVGGSVSLGHIDFSSIVDDETKSSCLPAAQCPTIPSLSKKAIVTGKMLYPA